MKILITGALGHIGSSLIRKLPEYFSSPEIIMIDDLSTQRYCSLFNLPSTARYHFIEGKVQSLDFSNLLKEVDAVVHLAALTDAAGTADKPELVHQNNYEATQKIAEACLAYNVPLIFPSSTSVYGSQASLVDESCKELAPQSPYAECKIKEEEFLQSIFHQGLKGVICRFGTIYGTSLGMRFHTAVNKFCWQAVMHQPITVWETALDQKRPYLALGDACGAISWIIKNQLWKGTIYNIVSNNYTVRDVVDEIKKHVPDLKIALTPHRIMNQLSYEVSAQKFMDTGFSFHGKLADGIKETVQILWFSRT